LSNEPILIQLWIMRILQIPQGVQVEVVVQHDVEATCTKF
jgi:hypothetical protein